MAENTIEQTAAAWTDFAREAAQTVTSNVMSFQERNVRFTKTLIEKSIEQTESQFAAARELAFSLAGPTEKQRVAYRDLAREAVSAYAELLGASTAIYQKSLNMFFDAAKQPTAKQPAAK